LLQRVAERFPETGLHKMAIEFVGLSRDIVVQGPQAEGLTPEAESAAPRHQ
jgi:hypothetical protein